MYGKCVIKRLWLSLPKKKNHTKTRILTWFGLMAYVTWKFLASYIFDIKHLILQWIQFRVYILENRKLQILGKFFFFPSSSGGVLFFPTLKKRSVITLKRYTRRCNWCNHNCLNRRSSWWPRQSWRIEVPPIVQ